MVRLDRVACIEGSGCAIDSGAKWRLEQMKHPERNQAEKPQAQVQNDNGNFGDGENKLE